MEKSKKIEKLVKQQEQKIKSRMFEVMTNDFNNFMNYANNWVKDQKKKKGE